MSDIRAKSDRLDEKIITLGDRLLTQVQRRMKLLASTLAIVVVCVVVQFLTLRSINAHIENAVNNEIPGLKVQIAQRDRTIAEKEQLVADQQFVLTEQAVPAIIAMGKQIKDLGGTPPQVVLKPPVHPTTTTTAKPR